MTTYKVQRLRPKQRRGLSPNVNLQPLTCTFFWCRFLGKSGCLAQLTQDKRKPSNLMQPNTKERRAITVWERIPMRSTEQEFNMKQLIKQALGVQPRDLPLQTRSLQMTMRWRTTTVAKKQSKFWCRLQNMSAVITLDYLVRDLLVLLLASL